MASFKTTSDRRATLRFLSTLAGAIAIAGSTAANAQSAAEWEAVIAAAKKEGGVTLYNGGLPTVVRSAAKLFEAQYGIKVTLLEARMSEIRERMRAEQAAGRWIADAVIAGNTVVSQQSRDGALQPHGPLPRVAKFVAPFQSDGTVLPLAVVRLGVLVNTRLVKPEDEPKSWNDLLLPKWKGKILSDDPRAAGGGNLAYWVLHDKFGRGFLEKMADQQLVFSRELSMNPKRVAAGEYAMLLPMSLSEAVKLKGLPVKLVVPKEGAVYGVEALAMAKNAPHPNAAKLLMNFLLDVKAQGEYTELAYASPTGQKPEKTPDLPKEALDAPLMGTTQPDPVKSDAMYKVFGEIYK